MGSVTKRHGVTLPTTTIQGREFFWVMVDSGVDIATSYDAVGSNFQKLITAVQQVAEIHIIGTPNGQNVTLALSMNTTPGSGEYQIGTISELKTAIDDSTGWSVSVYDAQLNGGNLYWD